MTIYRDQPAPLLCPRCGDVLDRVVDFVHVCMGCEGVWLGRAAVVAAFSTVYWPEGKPMWWRNQLACPVCKLAGASTALTAVATKTDEVLVDKCPEGHGVYLDRGELGHLMRAKGDELSALITELANVDSSVVGQKREGWLKLRAEREASAARRAAYLEKIANDQEALEQERLRQIVEERQAREEAEAQREAAEARRKAAQAAVEQASTRARLFDRRVELQLELKRLRETQAERDVRVRTINAEIQTLQDQRKALLDDHREDVARIAGLESSLAIVEQQLARGAKE